MLQIFSPTLFYLPQSCFYESFREIILIPTKWKMRPSWCHSLWLWNCLSWVKPCTYQNSKGIKTYSKVPELFVCCFVLLLFHFYRVGRENCINVKAVKLVFLLKVSGVRPVTSRKVYTEEQTSAFQGATEKLITGIWLCSYGRQEVTEQWSWQNTLSPRIKITNVCTLLLKEMQNLGRISNVL